MAKKPRKVKWYRRLRDNRNEEYQLVVRESKSFRELGQYSLTPLNVYVAVATFTVLGVLLIFLLIAFTPLRYYIPGYGGGVASGEIAEMEDLLEEMGQQMDAQAVYIENLRRTVHGEATTGDDVEAVGQLVDTANLEIVGASEEEIQLRREMDLERVGQANRAGGALTPTPGSDAVPLAQITLVPPVTGEISAGYNPTNGHRGVDILAPQSTPIKAVRDGIVFLSEFTSDNGNVIGIQHDHNLISFYKHNSRLLKEVGQTVRAGEAVAIIGNTGELTSGPHLHFELWHEGRVVDPVSVLRF